MSLAAKNVRTDADVRTFMERVRKRFQLANDSESSIREDALKDLRFRFSDQWDPKAKQIRDDDNRPCLTINRIPPFIHQITNEQRQQRPSITISPTGGAESFDTEELRLYADIWQGLIRHIEMASDAETAYDTAFENQVGNSFGWWRAITEYAGDDTFDQEIRIKRIMDPFSVYIDPSAQEPDRSDMRWAFVTSRISRDEYRRQFPKSEMTQLNFFTDFDGGPGAQWLTDEDLQIAEYYEIEDVRRKLQMLRAPAEAIDALVEMFGTDKTGQVDPATGMLELSVFEDEYAGKDLPEGITIEDERPVLWPKVMWYKVDGWSVLDETKWAGRYIPLVPCFGDEAIINGKRQIFSLTRFIRDSQVLLNYFRSQQAEVIALSPKAPFIGPVGSFKTKSQRWQNANNQNYAYLEYDPVTLPDGQLAPPPQRNTAESPIQAVSKAAADADNDMKAGAGIYNPALGAPSNETSGRAILARQKESDTSNFHFVDNFRRAIRHTGRILMDLIPHIYDRKNRIIRIVKPDNASEMVMINGDTNYKGKPAFFDPSVGRYDVNISVEPGFQTKLDETFALLSELTQSYPQLMQIAGDLVMRAAPLPGNLGMEIADRLKAALPPEIAAIANGNKAPDPAAQAAIAKSAQLIQMMTAEIQKLQDTIKTKRIEMASKERIANTQAIVTLLAADLKAKQADAQTFTEQEYGMLQHRLQLLHDSMSMEDEQAHEMQMAQQAQAAQAQQGAPGAGPSGAPAPVPPQPQTPPQPPTGHVMVKSSDGRVGHIPMANLRKAKQVDKGLQLVA